MKRLIILLAALLSLPTAYADCLFREDTATQIFQLGPFLDSTDGITVEAGLTVSNTDIRLSKNGGNFAAKASGGGTYDEVGMYAATFDADDTDTSGTLQIVIVETGAVPVFHECIVLATDEYDRITDNANALTSTMTGLILATDVATETSPTEHILTAGPSNNDAIPAGTAILFTGGGESCLTEATDYVGSTTTLHTAACTSIMTVAASDLVFVYATPAAPIAQAAITDIAANKAIIDAIVIDTDVIGNAVDTSIANDIANLAAGIILASGTCDSGSTTTCVDATLTEADDYWKGNAFVVTSGSTAGQTSCIYDFTASSDTILFRALTAAVSTNTYAIVENAVCEGVVAP